jgi:hypothetical protein
LQFTVLFKKNIQNRLMNAICKLFQPSQALLQFNMTNTLYF